VVLTNQKLCSKARLALTSMAASWTFGGVLAGPESGIIIIKEKFHKKQVQSTSKIQTRNSSVFKFGFSSKLCINIAQLDSTK
jgi:hypothetical protein